MIVLLPLNRCRVSYYVLSGRPYGVFERLILQAVSSGLRRVDDLQATFAVHPRLLVEALVTLTRSGWLAFGEGDDFYTTSEGEHALANGETPTDTRVDGPKEAFLFMEQLTGALAYPGECSYVTTQKLKDEGTWKTALKLRPTYLGGIPSPGDVAPYIKVDGKSWLGAVGPIVVVGQNSQWFLLQETDGRLDLSGLPRAWGGRLSEAIYSQLAESDEFRGWTLALKSEKRGATANQDRGVAGGLGRLRGLHIESRKCLATYVEHEL